MNPIIVPFLNNWAETATALDDLRQQVISPAPTILLIDQGSDPETAAQADAYVATYPQVLLWRHQPPLPSLAATWNRALQWAWESGAAYAWVCNNDIRVCPETYATLRDILVTRGAYFVTATGVTPEQYQTWLEQRATFAFGLVIGSGIAQQVCAWVGQQFQPTAFLPGPDFSCYLISRECHEKYPFDENFIPAYCEDLDYHRRLMLGGDGQKIHGTGLPFLHVGSGTLRAMDEERVAAWHRRIDAGSRAYYTRKWGGPANHETYLVPFGVPVSVQDQPVITTPELFEAERKKWASR